MEGPNGGKSIRQHVANGSFFVQGLTTVGIHMYILSKNK